MKFYHLLGSSYFSCGDSVSLAIKGEDTAFVSVTGLAWKVIDKLS